ncbi:hypothetical protein ACO1KB_05330 [Leptospira interrogans serovar Szwajizak]|uniref:hypothetical protein n=1 Tax=Leptospira interrogans TaxID=173 RepID=UPI003CF7CD5E
MSSVYECDYYVATAGSNIEFKKLNKTLSMDRVTGGKVRKIFLYQKNILFANKKTHSCRNT